MVGFFTLTGGIVKTDQDQLIMLNNRVSTYCLVAINVVNIYRHLEESDIK
jgi:hypothetical protein